MAGRSRSYMRGKLVNQIDFDSSCPFSTAGGYGEIYRGSLIREVHPNGSRHKFCYVALKSMRCGTDDDDNRLEKIIDEAAVWKALNHPHVLRFLGLLMDNRGTYLVSPLAAYGSLPQYLAQNPEADRPTFLAQMTAGLAYLHEMGIVHGDVKGANVLVFEGPSARICDFGLAKIADPSPGTTQNPIGTWYWMSPERMLLGQTRTKASDVYAFGLTIYEILSGNIPFAGMDYVTLIQAAHLRDERPPMQPESSTAGVSYALLWMLAARCWNRLAERRPLMEEARDIIVSSIGPKFIDPNHDDLPVLVAPPSQAVITLRKRRRVNSLPESAGTSDTDKSDATLGSTQHDHSKGKSQNEHGSNRVEALRALPYKTSLGLLVGCFFGWFFLLRVVPGDTSVLAADPTQDAGLSRPPDQSKTLIHPGTSLKALLLAVLGPSDRSLLPFVPRPIKLFVALIFVLNRRSWPLVWHYKLWKPVFRLRYDAFFKIKTIADRRQWVNQVSCVNADPFEVVSTIKCFAGFDDCDYNGHLSNSCYAKNVDAARMQTAMEMLPAIFGDGAWMPLAGAHYQFIKEIPYGTEYEIKTSIGGWDEKWLFLVHLYVSDSAKSSKSTEKASAESPGIPDVTVVPNVAIESGTTLVVDTPSASDAQKTVRQPGSLYKAPGTVPVFKVRKPLPEGTVVHCVGVSLYCFKVGRVTVPPKIALIAAGFGDPSKNRWMRVQELRFTPAPKSASPKGESRQEDGVNNKMLDMLKGGWKTDVNAPEGFWDLDEYEERRAAAMKEIFSGMRMCVQGLNEMMV